MRRYANNNSLYFCAQLIKYRVLKLKAVVVYRSVEINLIAAFQLLFISFEILKIISSNFLFEIFPFINEI